MNDIKHTKMLPSGGRRRRTYKGRKSVSPETQEGMLAHPEIAKKLNVKELRFLDAYWKTGSLARAYQTIYPRAKLHKACRESGILKKSIDLKLTQDEQFELMGLSIAKLGRVASEGLDANFQREFINLKTGEIHEGRVRPDHAVRATFLGHAMKLRKLDKDEGAGGIQVNLIMYAQPGAPPWPEPGGEEPIDVTPEEVT